MRSTLAPARPDSAIVAYAPDEFDVYRKLDGKVDAAEDDGIRARWEFGRKLLEERQANGGKQLPKGRLDAICAAVGKSPAEVRWRVQFAEEYDTPEKVNTAVLTSRSWTEIRDSLGERSAHVANNSGHIEWYTPPEYITAAVAVMGGIDLDPASCAEANRIVGAATFYDEQDDGLSQEWSGRVWMNPPYAAGLNDKFCTKLRDAYIADQVSQACVIVNNATETAWFQTLGKVANAFCFPSGRISFWRPDRDSLSPLQGQAFMYLGENVEGFRVEFGQFGITVIP